MLLHQVANAPERVAFPQGRNDGEHENIEETGGMGVLQAGLSLTDLKRKRCRRPERNPIPHARWIEKKTTGRMNPDRDPRFAAVCTDTKRLANAYVPPTSSRGSRCNGAMAMAVKRLRTNSGGMTWR